MSALLPLVLGNWRTTLVGLLGAVVAASSAYLAAQPGVWPYIGAGLVAIVGALMKDKAPTPPAP